MPVSRPNRAVLARDEHVIGRDDIYTTPLHLRFNLLSATNPSHNQVTKQSIIIISDKIMTSAFLDLTFVVLGI